MNSPSLVIPSQQTQQQAQHQHQQHHHQQQPSQHLYSNHQQQQPPTLHTHKNSPMGQQQNLEQIREETVMETAMDNFMAGVESGEYFAQLQLQSPQLPQAPYSLQSQSTFDYSGSNSTNNNSNSAMAISTPLLASQSQTVFDMSGTPGAAGDSTTPTVASTSLSSTGLMTSSMDGSSGYGGGGYPQFSSSANPLFSSPPISSSGAFSPTMPSMSNYFTHQPMTSTNSHRHQFFSNNIIIPPGGSLPAMSRSPHEDSQMTGDHGSSAYMSDSQDTKAWLWDSYPTTNPTPSVEVLMQMQQQEQQQQQQQQQHQQQQQYQLSQDLSSSSGNPAQQQPFMHSQPPPHPFYQQAQDHIQSPPLSAIQPGYTVSSPVTTPPTTPQRHPRLFHSQSQPGLRNIQQQQQKQQLLQQQQQHGLRHRQHSVHFTGGGFVSGDLSGMRTNRHVSLPVGSYSAPIPSLASLSEMMQDSPLGSAGGNDGPPPPMHHHHHHHHFLPTSPPLSSTDLSGASTPTTPKSRSRAGSKSRSRPTSASSVVSVRNAGAPYSPSITNTSGPISVAAASRSPSLIPLSPIPPFKLGDDTDPTSPPPNSYDSGMILVPGTPGAAGNATGASPSGGVAGTTAGGKARRISRTKLPSKSRSRSSTLTASNAGSGLVAGSPAEVATGNLATSPFSLVLSEQEEADLQGLADASGDSLQHHHLQQHQHHQQQLHVQSGIELTPSGSQPGDDIDPFQLDATVQHQQYQHLDPAMLNMSSALNEPDGGLDEDLEDDDGMDEDGAGLGEDGSSTPGAEESLSSANANPTGKPIPCPIPSCSKTFARPFNLNAHVKSHDVLKPYGCHLCSRVFSRKHDLQRHIRVHTGSKPYVCVNCQKAFARTDALCRHYKCEEACREFMQQDEVRKQAQQNVQHSLHQEQIELQQAQQAFALARQQEAEARAAAAAVGGYILEAVAEDATTRTGADVVDELSIKSIIKTEQQQQHQQPKLRRVSTITSLSAAAIDSKTITTTTTTTVTSSSAGTDGSVKAESQQDL
ncbi:hypothetical protein BG015_000862 [Linnemannia schmuckeri]|uniref:C2H2-type domain-containing protein n=1 Tax=Linnemannia schmuckeri TaxID=64567 RepID=A0A9P5RSN2_9FUNG|nr:hypothetical protein BG015_000862 [Linnemannia schmuckeri]